MPSAKRVGWGLLVSLGVLSILAAVLGIGYVAIHVVPDWLGNPKNVTANQVAERGRIRTATLAFLAGVVAAAGAVFTGLTFRLSRRGQGTDRFSKAIEHLGHAEMNIRIGGIHALGQLARDDPRKHHRAVLEVLISFIRDRSPWPPPSGAPRLIDRLTARFPGAPSDAELPVDDQAPPAALDIRAAVAVLARRKSAYDPEPTDIDLSNTNLRGVRAPGISLRGARLKGTQLQEADLTGADLFDADLVAAQLDDAILEKAQVGKASLQTSRLVGTKLRNVKGLDSAKVNGAVQDPLTTDWPPGFDPAARGIKTESSAHTQT